MRFLFAHTLSTRFVYSETKHIRAFIYALYSFGKKYLRVFIYRHLCNDFSLRSTLFVLFDTRLFSSRHPWNDLARLIIADTRRNARARYD